MQSASLFILWVGCSFLYGVVSDSVAELAAQYHAQPRNEPLFLGLCVALGGVLCNLADDYRACPADVLFALMCAVRRAPVYGDATQEIAGRMRGLLQAENRKEARRSRVITRYAASGSYPVYSRPPAEDRLDVVRAVDRLKPEERSIVVGADVEGKTSAELAKETGSRSEQSIKTRRWQIRRKLKNFLEEPSK